MTAWHVHYPLNKQINNNVLSPRYTSGPLNTLNIFLKNSFLSSSSSVSRHKIKTRWSYLPTLPPSECFVHLNSIQKYGNLLHQLVDKKRKYTQTGMWSYIAFVWFNNCKIKMTKIVLVPHTNI